MLTSSPPDFFFTDQYGRSWNNSYYPLALADPRLGDLDFNFRGTFEVSEHYMPEKMVPDTIPFAPDGIDNVGPVDSDNFWKEVQNARILVGIGSVRDVKNWTGNSSHCHCRLVHCCCHSVPTELSGLSFPAPCSGSSFDEGRGCGCGCGHEQG